MKSKRKEDMVRPYLGYPLTQILEESTFEKIMGSLQLTLAASQTSGAAIETDLPAAVTTETVFSGQGEPNESDSTSLYQEMYQLVKNVYLCKFRAKVTRGNGDYYVYDVGLNSNKTIGVLLKNPPDTVVTFGRKRRTTAEEPALPSVTDSDRHWRRMAAYVAPGPAARSVAFKKRQTEESERSERQQSERQQKEEDPSCDLNLRFVVNQKNVLEVLYIHGPDIEIFFSKGLVKPVRKNAQGKYEPTGRRQKVKLGNKLITIARSMPPKLSEPLTFEGDLVQIGGQNIIARLKEVDLGGTYQEPKLIFTDVELVG